MKRIATLGMLLFLTIPTWSQQSAVDKVFDKYSGKEGYTTVYISSFMFNLLNSLDVDDPDYNEFKKATSGITSIKILSQEDNDAKPFGRELLDMLPKSEYKEMMVVKDEDEEVLFLARENGNRITEFLLIVSGGDEDVLIAIQGNIDLESLSSIAKGLDMPGMENLENLKDK